MRAQGGALASEKGAGGVLLIAVMLLSLGALAMSQLVVSNLISQHRLQATADAAAIAADDALRGLTTGYPCDVAKQVAKANMMILEECRILGLEAFVSLQVQGIGIVLNARARAGPSN